MIGPDWILRAIYSVGSAYMLMILLRWLGPWLDIDFRSPRLSWIPKLTDPFFQLLRKTLPPLGPVDLTPLIALVLVWLLRQFALAMASGIV